MFKPGPCTYWRMIHTAAALAADPWAPAVLLDQDKQFCGRMPIPDAAALVEGTWDSLRHAEQDIADEGQPSFFARTSRARTLVLRYREFRRGLQRLQRVNVELVGLLRRYQQAQLRRTGVKLGVDVVAPT